MVAAEERLWDNHVLSAFSQSRSMKPFSKKTPTKSVPLGIQGQKVWWTYTMKSKQ